MRHQRQHAGRNVGEACAVAEQHDAQKLAVARAEPRPVEPHAQTVAEPGRRLAGPARAARPAEGRHHVEDARIVRRGARHHQRLLVAARRIGQHRRAGIVLGRQLDPAALRHRPQPGDKVALGVERGRQVFAEPRGGAHAVMDQAEAGVAEVVAIAPGARPWRVHALRIVVVGDTRGVDRIAQVELVDVVFGELDLAELALVRHPLRPVLLQIVDPFVPRRPQSRTCRSTVHAGGRSGTAGRCSARRRSAAATARSARAGRSAAAWHARGSGA